MSYPKLGKYRSVVNAMKKKYKITALDFDIVLYASEQDMVSQYDLTKNVSNSVGSVRQSLTYLEKMGLLKVVRKPRKGKGGMPGGYAITGRARNMITGFYMTMFPNEI
jgi:predicted transcriptional regulator